jgi:hypothetical protein
MKRWIAYVAASVLVLLIGSAVALLMAPAEAAASVALAAGIALAVQLLAFGVLVAFGAGRGFLAGFLGGVALRFGTVLAVALTVTRAGSFDAATLLLSLVAFVFVLLLLEPVFLNRTLSTR